MRACVQVFLAGSVICAAAWVVLDLRLWHGPLHAWLMQAREEPVAAEAGGMPITQQELQEALKARLWKSGETWAALSSASRKSARESALQSLIDARLVRAARLRAGWAPDDSAVEVRREADRLSRQFADRRDYVQRLALQGQTQDSMKAAIREAQLDEAWLAAQVAPQLAPIREHAAPAWHARFKETLRIPAAHHVAHLFLSRNDRTAAAGALEIGRIHRQLVEGKSSFAALVERYSEDPRSKALGGDLGWVARQRMPADFMSAVEKLEPGQVSPPVTTALGWHLILVRERRASRLPAFAEVREETTAFLANARRTAAVSALVAGLRQDSAAQVLLHRAVINQCVPAR